MTPNRDILVMFRQELMSQQDMEREVLQLNKILFTAERLNNFAAAHEVFDLNRYRIIRDLTGLKKIIRQKKMSKPFIFFSNKN